MTSNLAAYRRSVVFWVIVTATRKTWNDETKEFDEAQEILINKSKLVGFKNWREDSMAKRKAAEETAEDKVIGTVDFRIAMKFAGVLGDRYNSMEIEAGAHFPGNVLDIKGEVKKVRALPQVVDLIQESFNEVHTGMGLKPMFTPGEPPKKGAEGDEE